MTAPIPLAAIAIVSQSGDRDGVTIDGGGAGGHLFEVVGSDVTIAHVTLARSYDDLVHAAPAGTDVTNRVMLIVGAAVIGALGVTVVARLVHGRGVRAVRARA